jgi:hypothetical protein
MSNKPDVVYAHVLVYVDEYQNARDENAEQDIGDLGYGVRRVKIGK